MINQQSNHHIFWHTPCSQHNAGGTEPLPEGLLWLLLTGEVPTSNQVEGLRVELNKRSAVPDHVLNMIRNFPKDLHPMSQFSAAVYVIIGHFKHIGRCINMYFLFFYIALLCKRTANSPRPTRMVSRRPNTGMPPSRIPLTWLVRTLKFT